MRNNVELKNVACKLHQAEITFSLTTVKNRSCARLDVPRINLKHMISLGKWIITCGNFYFRPLGETPHPNKFFVYLSNWRDVKQNTSVCCQIQFLLFCDWYFFIVYRMMICKFACPTNRKNTHFDSGNASLCVTKFISLMPYKF